MEYFDKYIKYKAKYTEMKQYAGAVKGWKPMICHYYDERHPFTITYPKCAETLRKIYPNCSYKKIEEEKEEEILKEKYEITFDEYKIDPFFTNLKNIDIFNWYLSKNPDRISLMKANPNIPEYEYLVANITKDYYLLYIYKKFPNGRPINNFPNIEDKLTKINEAIMKNYKYNDIMTVSIDYLIFFQNQDNPGQINNHCSIPYLDESSQFILFPSFHQPNYWKLLLLYGAPVINFFITNHKHYSHTQYEDVCYEISHDIRYHYGLFMDGLYNQYFPGDILMTVIPDPKKVALIKKHTDQIKTLIEKISDSNELFYLFFSRIRLILDKIKPLIVYNKFTINNQDPDFNKSLNAFYFFYLFHETTFADDIIKSKNMKHVLDKFYLKPYEPFISNHKTNFNNFSSGDKIKIVNFMSDISTENLKHTRNCVKMIIDIYKILFDAITPQDKQYLKQYYNEKEFNNDNLYCTVKYEHINEYVFDLNFIDYEFKMFVLNNYYNKNLHEGIDVRTICYIKNRNVDGFIFSDGMDYNMTPENNTLLINFMVLILTNTNDIVKALEVLS